jgi:methylated-DNA-protein-cysteine methyltransferase-like protein
MATAKKKAAKKKTAAKPKAKAKTKPTASRARKSSSTQPIREKLTAIRPSGQKEDNFFELVHEVARQIPRGRVTSYGAIAAALGTRLSARMVGWAMNACHLSPKPVPAHRVVNSLGLLTGRHHFNPPEKMQELLEKEGTLVKDNKVVDFKTKFWNPSEEL